PLLPHSSHSSFSFLLSLPPPAITLPLFSYTTLFRSNPSTRFSQEPCFGVNTNSNLPGTPARYFLVSWEVCTWRLSNTNRILSSLDRNSTRLNSSHVSISYAVFCLKKKNKDSTYVTKY